MKVLLVVPKYGESKESQAFPLGLLSIATYLDKLGHEVFVYDRNISKEKMGHVIESFKPQLVGVSITVISLLRDAVKLSKTAKKYGLPVCWGGVIPSLIDPGMTLKEDYVDFVSFGEGEFTWLELVEHLRDNVPFEDVLGLAYKDGGEILVNEERPQANLADVPVLNWSLIDPEKYGIEYMSCKKMGYTYSGKGCPSRCKFCCNKPLHRCIYRARPMEYVLQEIEDLCDNYGFDGFYFMDEIWIANHNDIVEKCEAIKKTGKNFTWGCMFKVGIASAEDYRLMAEAGCRWILFGIESGSPSLHRKMTKGLPFGKIEKSVCDAANAGIRPITSFIVGYVDETEDEIRETIELVKKLIDKAIVLCNFFTPLVGSDAYNELIAAGRIKKPTCIDDFHSDTFDFLGVNYSSIPDRDIKVIRAVLWLWSYISGDKTIGETSNKQAFLASLTAAFKTMFSNDLKTFFKRVFYAFKLSFTVIFNYVCFPKIRKKYNLYLKK